MVVLPIDPFRVHVYWTIEGPDLEADPAAPPEAPWGADPVLRFYSIPLDSSAIEDCTECFDVPVRLDAPNWYVQLPKPSTPTRRGAAGRCPGWSGRLRTSPGFWSGFPGGTGESSLPLGSARDPGVCESQPDSLHEFR